MNKRKINYNKLIYSRQHGFTMGKSCLTGLIEFFYMIFEWYDQGDSLDIMYLDFSKAFDKVPYKRFISKLESYGIQRNVLRWISSELKGSVSRPLLFTILLIT